MRVAVTPRFPKHHSRLMENVTKCVKKKVMGVIMQKIDFGTMAATMGCKP